MQDILASDAEGWERLTDFPFGSIDYHASALIGDELYMFGGRTPNVDSPGVSVINRTFKLHIPTDTWSEISTTNTPTARMACSLVAIDGLLYMYGGNPLNGECWMLDPSTGVWTTCTSGINSNYHRAVTYQGKMVVVGGVGPTSAQTVRIYDPSTDTWTVDTTPGWSIADHGMDIWGDEIWTYGGRVSSQPSDVIRSYNLTSGTWTARGVSGPARQQNTLTNLNGGGYSYGGTPDLTTDRFKCLVQPSTWIELADSPSNRFAHTATVWQDKIITVGGSKFGTGQTNEVWLYRPGPPLELIDQNGQTVQTLPIGSNEATRYLSFKFPRTGSTTAVGGQISAQGIGIANFTVVGNGPVQLTNLGSTTFPSLHQTGIAGEFTMPRLWDEPLTITVTEPFSYQQTIPFGRNIGSNAGTVADLIDVLSHAFPIASRGDLVKNLGRLDSAYPNTWGGSARVRPKARYLQNAISYLSDTSQTSSSFIWMETSGVAPQATRARGHRYGKYNYFLIQTLLAPLPNSVTLVTYDTEQNVWLPPTALSSITNLAGTAAVDLVMHSVSETELWVGMAPKEGRDSQELASNTNIYRLTLGSDGTWTNISGALSITNGGVGAAYASIGGQLYIFGGWRGYSNYAYSNVTGLTEAFRINPTTGAGMVLADLPYGLYGAAACAMPDGRILITGGRTTNTDLKSTLFYDPSTDTYTPGPNLNNARAFHQIGMDYIYATIYGGQNSSSLTLGEMFFPGTPDRWLNVSGTDLLSGEIPWNCGVAYQPGRIMLYGGSNGGGAVPSSQRGWIKRLG